MAMAGPSAKRPTIEAHWASSLCQEDDVVYDACMPIHFNGQAFFHATIAAPNGGILRAQFFSDQAPPQDAPRPSRKRVFDEHEMNDLYPDSSLIPQHTVQAEESLDWLQPIPDFRTNMPSAHSRPQIQAPPLTNPFEENKDNRYSWERKGKRKPIFNPSGTVNSYVKFKVLGISTPQTPQLPVAQQQSMLPIRVAKPRGYRFNSHEPGSAPRNLPPGFGRKHLPNPTDEKLFDFYVRALCSGRTLLPKTNGWLMNLAPMAMAENNPGMLHALLAFTAGYAMDYTPNLTLINHANMHYKKACTILSQELRNPENLIIGKEDTLVGMLRLLWCDDIVQWELRRDTPRTPRWLEAVHHAKTLLEKTDPGSRYYRVHDVQCSGERTSNANMCAFVDMLTWPLAPYNVASSDCCHPWILEGTEKESRRIYGGTGMSPKLLHMFGQITHLCSLMKADPASTMIPLGAKALDKKLENFQQWSELGDGYPTVYELLESCQLDEHGLISTPQEATDLTGQAWVQTARIYLKCRFFRLPRKHPKVRECVNILVRLLAKLPCSGELFTSQYPFFAIVLLSLVATRESERKVGRNWFEEVVSRASARSSVPPIWNVVKDTQLWLDSQSFHDSQVDKRSIGDRMAWWDLMVDRIYENHGILNMS